jgi:hypothetical protein
MGNLIRLASVMGALTRGLKSRTTKDQWMGNLLFFVLACGLGALTVVYGGVSEEVVLGVILAAQQAVGPYFARLVVWLRGRLSGKVKADPTSFVVKVRYEKDGMWKVFTGTLNDARIEGYDYGVLLNGEEVKLKFMEKTGRKLRLQPSGISGEAEKGV